MRLAWLWSRFARPRRSDLHVVVYTRGGCHLCDIAWEQLERQRQRYGFSLEAVDVDGDPELTARYGDTVPVVTINGKERFRGRVNEVLLRRLLRSL
jgi:glutaredoxin